MYSMPRVQGVVTGVIAGRGTTMGSGVKTFDFGFADGDDVDDVLLYSLRT